MKIVCSSLYEQQLKAILAEFETFKSAKDFKLYLDTIVMNAPTKARKYKQSIYFDDEDVKDIEYEDYTIIMHINEEKESYFLVGIVKK